ncbi:uncharacterized protein LOC135388387 [Ornithodoros turicata]|uniref:uncharacterized protein LOC135388387 n=1 Tax=Ornithodoros turicata TaxID=34597 RepID=UPI0031392816
MLAVLLLVIVGSVSGTELYKESFLNDYTDAFLDVVLPINLGKRPAAYPLESFNVKVLKTWYTNRDLKAEFHNGRLTGLKQARALRKVGDCSRLQEGTTVTWSCTVEFTALKAAYDGTARGENLAGINRSLNFEANFLQPRGVVEIQFFRSTLPVLKSWRVLPLNMSFSFSREPDLNDQRRKSLEDELKRNIGVSVTRVLYGPFQQDLNTTVSDAMSYVLLTGDNFK